MRTAWAVALSLSSLAALSAAQVQFLGVAIAGGDFGCDSQTGACPTGSAQLPLGGGGGGGDGPGQMQHWAALSPRPVNMFRLPTSWQWLANNQPAAAALDAGNLAKYDQLVQACLATGAHCMVDIHNFARWDGGVIGQGGPTDDQFVGLWAQLAAKYASEPRMVFELMNEPHDLDINVWAATCQKVVTAIRNAGATSQMILLPGTNFDSAASLVSSGSVAALMGVTNPDGTTDNLLLDIHKYLDEDNSGTHTTCTTNNIDAFTTVADALRQAGRKGFVSESGASSDSSCMTNFCAQNTFINQNADVFVGLVGWGAGSFDTSYVLGLTPTGSKGAYVDNQVMQQCLLDVWNNTTTTAAVAADPAPSSTSAAVPVVVAPAPSSSSSAAAAVVAPAPPSSSSSSVTRAASGQSTVYITPIEMTTVTPVVGATPAAAATTTTTSKQKTGGGAGAQPGTSTMTLSTATEQVGGLETASGTPTGGGAGRGQGAGAATTLLTSSFSSQEDEAGGGLLMATTAMASPTGGNRAASNTTTTAAHSVTSPVIISAGGTGSLSSWRCPRMLAGALAGTSLLLMLF